MVEEGQGKDIQSGKEESPKSAQAPGEEAEGKEKGIEEEEKKESDEKMEMVLVSLDTEPLHDGIEDSSGAVTKCNDQPGEEGQDQNEIEPNIGAVVMVERESTVLEMQADIEDADTEDLISAADRPKKMKQNRKKRKASNNKKETNVTKVETNQTGIYILCFLVYILVFVIFFQFTGTNPVQIMLNSNHIVISYVYKGLHMLHLVIIWTMFAK